MNHTYMNTGVSDPQKCSSEVTDNDFLTDANVYYNLPPPLPPVHHRGTSLPHHSPQHPLINRASSSCPASPKLPPASSSPRRGGHAQPRAPTGTDKAAKPALPPAVPDRDAKKSKHEKLSHTRSFDLDNIYQNIRTAVKGASKPHSNSLGIPFWRKKKSQEASKGIAEKGGRGGGTPQPLPSPSVTSSATNAPENGSRGSPPRTQGSRASLHSSSSGSSSDSSNDDNDSDDDYRAEVCPGVTYIRKDLPAPRPHGAQDEDANTYNNTATLPLRSGKLARQPNANNKQHNVNFDVNANLEEWHRKEQWLKKKRSSRNLRLLGENSGIDIAILYATDGTPWKNYLYETFTRCVGRSKGTGSIGIETVNVEEIEDDIGSLQAVKLKSAKLQIVILSPCFMDHIANHARSELGHVFKPRKLLCLLLNVDNSNFTSAHLSALYSYNEWRCLKVRSEDMSFVQEVLHECTNILNSSELYADYQDERFARFKIVPRKVTMMQPQIFILLNEEAKGDVVISVNGKGREPRVIKTWRLRNPYTISFLMPEEFLKTYCLMYITVSVNGENIGSRQLKCERNMDTVRSILVNARNPTDFMCQALNLNPLNDDLDQCLARSFSMRIPLSRCQDNDLDRGFSEFPTWIHFSAYYGLKMFTWALLQVPGARAALTVPNCHGDTPSVLAFKSGYVILAQELEAEVKSARTREVPSSHEVKKGVLKVSEDTYNSPPPPRPLRVNYDTLPAPRLVFPGSSPPAPSGASPESSLCVTPSPVMSTPISSNQLLEEDTSSSCNEEGYVSQQSLLSDPNKNDFYSKSLAVKEVVESYLDMNVTGRCAKHEEGEDFYTTVTRTLTDRSQDKHTEMSFQSESSKAASETAALEQDQSTTVTPDQRSEDTVSESESGATYIPTQIPTQEVPDSTNRSTADLVRQFVGMLGGRRRPLHLEGTRSLRDEPNYYIDDPTLNSMAGRTKFNKDAASENIEERQVATSVSKEGPRHGGSPAAASASTSSNTEVQLSDPPNVTVRNGPEPTEEDNRERPPLPTPLASHSDDENEYLDHSRINTPRRYEILLEQQSTSPSNSEMYYNLGGLNCSPMGMPVPLVNDQKESNNVDVCKVLDKDKDK